MRIPWLLVLVLAVLLAACTAAGELADSTSTTPAVATSTTLLPTADEILADGEITDDERELARQAVFECLQGLGADTTLELFDIDPIVRRDYFEELQECQLPYVGIYRRVEVFDDQFDIGLLGVVRCTEDRTGRNYGPKTIDDIGRLTDESRETIFQAINTDEKIYKECFFELRLDPDREVKNPDITEYGFDDGNPKRVSLRVSACGYIPTGRLVAETETQVVVEAVTVGEPDESCWILHPIRLKEPLGDRDIIDNTTGEAVPAESI